MTFSLLSNPFAILRATPRTPVADLPGLAEAAPDPAAPAAARTLSVPRTRLPAELAFLPGLDDAATARVLAALDGDVPDPARLPPLTDLPPAARANVLAHLCAAGLSTPAHHRALLDAQRPPGDPALATLLDADRAAAGLPAVQPTPLRTEAEALADRHAAALLSACLADPDPATPLAALVEHAPPGPPAALARKLAAGWARHAASLLLRDEEEADAALTALEHDSGPATLGHLVTAITAWAAHSRPQRLADARAGLDHDPTLRALRRWKATVRDLNDRDQPRLALDLAGTLARTFADLPGEGANLRDALRELATAIDRQALEHHLAPLRATVQRLGDDPAPLRAALEKAPFGTAARGPAGELWAAFDTAAAACHPSEAPWALLAPLQSRLGGEHNPAGAAAALSLLRGLLARAEAAGLPDLAARLRTGLRGLERAAARWRFEGMKARARKSWSPGNGPSHQLAAGRALLALTDDPDERGALDTETTALARRIRRTRIAVGALAGLVAAFLGASWADSSYAGNAPWLGVAPRPLVAPTRPATPALAPVVPNPDPKPGPAPDALPGLRYMPKAPEPPAAPSFPVLPSLAERLPREGGEVRTVPEVRWCAFNDIRLQAAAVAATPAEVPAMRPMEAQWRALCLSYTAQRRDEDQVKAEAAHNRARLLDQGRAMLKAPR